jgi:hypothetical protein
MRLLRHDLGPLNRPRKLANGSLVADALLTRIGIFEYRNDDGSTRRELRLPEEVFSADALASLAMLPVTVDHPPEEISPANARQFTVGTVGEGVKRDGDFVRASLVLFDAAAISAVEAGKHQVSVGYHLDLDETPGVWRGEKYDAVQRAIRGNHLAIVDQGRAGPVAAIRIDTKEPRNMKIKIGQSEYEVDEAVGKYVADLETKAISATTELASLKVVAEQSTAKADAAEAQVKVLTGERDQAKARADAAVEQADPAKLQAAIKARVALETEARKHVAADLALDSLTDRQVREAVIKRYSPSVDLSKESDEYVRARCDAALEQTSPAILAARVAGNSTTDTSEEAARAASLKANNEAWRSLPTGAVQKGN